MSGTPNPRNFVTTRWSLIQHAAGNEIDADEALNDLCRAYENPIRKYCLRVPGINSEDADDITYGFLAEDFTQKLLTKAEKDKGKFRSFLLGALKFYIKNYRRKQPGQSLSRGSGYEHLPLDHPDLNLQIKDTNSIGEAPDDVFERAWAEEVLHKAVNKLKNEYDKSDQGELFDSIYRYLVRDYDGGYATIAVEHGVSVGMIKMFALRAKKKLQDSLLEVIADTVSDPGEIEDELKYLKNLFGR